MNIMINCQRCTFIYSSTFFIIKNICYQWRINELADKCNVSRSSILLLAKKLEFRVYLKRKTQGEIIQETTKGAKQKLYKTICKLMDNSNCIFVFETGNLQMNCSAYFSAFVCYKNTKRGRNTCPKFNCQRFSLGILLYYSLLHKLQLPKKFSLSLQQI